MNSSALELSLKSQNNIEINKEFQVEINLDSEETYDVKIFAHDSPDNGVTRDEYISQIFNTEKNIWQSSWNYLSNSYPKEKEYKLKITESSGERKICVRVRKAGTDSSISKCNSILVSINSTNEDIDNENLKNEETDEKLDDKSDKESNNENNKKETRGQSKNNIKYADNINNNPNNLEELSFSENKQLIYENEEIILKSNKNFDSNKIKDLENQVYKTKKQNTLIGVFYIFNLFLLFIVILLMSRKFNKSKFL